MCADLLSRLEACKRQFGTADPAVLESLLDEVALREFEDPQSLLRLHETLLFLRAYPASIPVARRCDEILDSFAARICRLGDAGTDLTPFEEAEVSGIAGTALAAVFSYETARSLVDRHPTAIEIDYDAWDSDNAGAVLRRLLPLLEEDWPVEAHVPYQRWIDAARKRGETGIGWLLGAIARLPLDIRVQAEIYDSLRLPLRWTLGDAAATRSRLRLATPSLFCHSEALIHRNQVSIASELAGPALPVARIPKLEAHRLLETIVDTSAMRYRELYGFNHADTSRMLRADLGRGVVAYLFGVPPQWRLPLRAYHAGMYFKNGVPAGYIEVLSLFERAEVGFNLYYTFRDGESAWLYARLLKLLNQVLGVTCFSVDPYQIGDENAEAIDSGAFWFYRKLGFRPLDSNARKALAREEKQMLRDPGHRSSRATLEKLAKGYILWDGNGDHPGDLDGFRIRNVGIRASAQGLPVGSGFDVLARLIPDVRQWPASDRKALDAIRAAKSGPDESRYLRLTQRHSRLRAAVLKLGCELQSTPEQTL